MSPKNTFEEYMRNWEHLAPHHAARIAGYELYMLEISECCFYDDYLKSLLSRYV